MVSDDSSVNRMAMALAPAWSTQTLMEDHRNQLLLEEHILSYLVPIGDERRVYQGLPKLTSAIHKNYPEVNTVTG